MGYIDHGHQPIRLGCPSNCPTSTGHLVSFRNEVQYQLAGATCSSFGVMPLPAPGFQQACAHINRQHGHEGPYQSTGGTHSRSLMGETERLMLWTERHIFSLKAEHISGSLNLQADWLSRGHLAQSEWMLHPQLFQILCHKFRTPILDLFATAQNVQLLRYFSRLRSPWPQGLFYTFPPIPLLPTVIRKPMVEQVDLLLVAPLWPRQLWIADLMGLSVKPPWRILHNQFFF